MAKMTLSQLQTFVKTYVDATKQAGAWSKSTDNFVGLIDKIGKQVTLDGVYNDKLAIFDGDELPLGKTIEEYFIDLTMPTDYDASGSTDLAPALPTVEDVAYSFTLGRKKIKTTVPYDNFERACIDSTTAANVSADIMNKFAASGTLYRYALKKQGIANLIGKATNANLVSSIAVPTDTDTSEAFIKAVKGCVEDASFANDSGNLGQFLAGAAPELVLVIKKGVMPTVEVDAIAGAFHSESLALPARTIVVDDFGSDNSGAFAVLMDPRGLKLHRGYHAIRSKENADGDFVNFVDHSEYTLFISKATYVHVFKTE